MSDNYQAIAEIIDAAEVLERPEYPARDSAPKHKTRGRKAAPVDPSPLTAETAAAGNTSFRLPPAPPPEGERDLTQTLEHCAALDQSDTDNGQRLISYFGNDILVLAQSGVSAGDFLTWTGTHWDLDGGLAGAMLYAQRVGDLVAREADLMASTPREVDAIDRASAARAELRELNGAAHGVASVRAHELKGIIAIGDAARGSLLERKKARRKFGVTTKNASKIKAMLECAGPHLRRPPEAFNADPYLAATRTHTLRFVREYDRECPDPDVIRVSGARVDAVEGHDRSHLLTGTIPVDYDPSARTKRWQAFVDRFLPDGDVRRTVQQFTGASMLGMPLQNFMLHHGLGANGKSVFLETITRLLGPSIAVGLPVESVTGKGERGAGGASPDIARLYGKRMVRVTELPPNQPLQIETVKRLTGGEAIPVRTMYKGFFEFQPICKPHFSTNGEPYVDDASNGIWRRMLPVRWPIALEDHEQRDFEEVVGELLEEAPGILNWLIAGAIDFLANGLVVADAITVRRQEYRDEMDPTGPFLRDCVNKVEGQQVQAAEMYRAYQAWSAGVARRAVSMTKFGLLFKYKLTRDDKGHTRKWVNVQLHDVPWHLLDDDKSGTKKRPSHTESPAQINGDVDDATPF